MAHAGYGEPLIVTNPQEALKQAKRFGEYISSPVLTNIKLHFEGIEAYDLEPPTIPDLFANRPLLIQGKYRSERVGKLTISGSTGSGTFKKTISLKSKTNTTQHEALKYLWARAKIKRYTDLFQSFGGDLYRDTITNLGLQYALLTRFTSFIAIDERVRNTEGDSKAVKQPLPLPKGVNNSAVGGFAVPTAPEPELCLLILLMSMIFLGTLKRKQREILDAQYR